MSYSRFKFPGGVRGRMLALDSLDITGDEQINLALYDVRGIEFVSDHRISE